MHPCGFAVEPLRGAYTTLMRFYSDTDEATEIAWYPVPDDRPWLPIAHAFGSDEWVADNGWRQRTPGHYGIGEQLDADRKRPQRAVWRAQTFNGVYCGSLESWQRGDGLPVIPPAAYADGFPVCCGPPGLPFPTGWDCPLAYTMALLVQLLYDLGEPDQAVFEEAVTNAFGGPFICIAWNPTPTGSIPRYAVLRCSAWYVVIVGGTQTDEQWLRQVFRAGNVFTYTNDDGTGYSTNSLYQDVAVRIANAIRFDARPDWPVLMAGHSLGGAATNIMSMQLSHAVRSRRVMNITFGAPRCMSPFDVRDVYRSTVADNVNLWIAGDIIPALPPYLSDATQVTLVGGLVNAFFRFFWANPSPQFRIDDVGRWITSGPGAITTPALTALLAFITNNGPWVALPNHAIAEYVRRLSFQRCEEVPGVQPSPALPGPDLWLAATDLPPEGDALVAWPPHAGTPVTATAAATGAGSGPNPGGSGWFASLPGFPPGPSLWASTAFVLAPAPPHLLVPFLQFDPPLVVHDFTFFLVVSPNATTWRVCIAPGVINNGDGLYCDDSGVYALRGGLRRVAANPIRQPSVVCWRRTGAQWDVFVNCLKVATAADTALQETYATAYGFAAGTNHHSGFISELIAWSRSLDSDEMETVFEMLKPNIGET